MSDQAPALHAPAPPPTDSDYDSILAAVMETARGRWFLHEYARRNRSAETGALLAAIGRIEALLESRDDTPEGTEQPASLDTPAAEQLAATHDAMATILDSLIECGAPSFLCNDLARHLKTLKALGMPGREQAPDRLQSMETHFVETPPMETPPVEMQAQPAETQFQVAETTIEVQVVEVCAEVADAEPMAARTELPAVTIGPVADAASAPLPAPEPADPFADIRALSASEKIALFS
jgi:hypothetical protein